MEYYKELDFSNVVNASLDKELKFLTIHLLQYTKIANIKRLGKVQGISRKIEGNNSIVLTELLELSREVALIAV